MVQLLFNEKHPFINLSIPLAESQLGSLGIDKSDFNWTMLNVIHFKMAVLRGKINA